jgi:hypothetical protein
LDWEQYPIIYNTLYLDVDNWTPEEVASFQDAIYKSEKDFNQVSKEVRHKSIRRAPVAQVSFANEIANPLFSARKPYRQAVCRLLLYVEEVLSG